MDIDALMILFSDNAVQDNLSLFFGKRNNGRFGDDENEPYPHTIFINVKSYM
uniref:Uncharacterized protein n=1 Tax=Mimiviridae sp. ChoanoV1 TaxID=2596887 RepID=A0A5B8IID3_9VIRU|nr:hypothetical protein 6_47 [Mimiviridae sp. ChoanoV1]